MKRRGKRSRYGGSLGIVIQTHSKGEREFAFRVSSATGRGFSGSLFFCGHLAFAIRMQPAWGQAVHRYIGGACIRRLCRTRTAQAELSDRLEQPGPWFCRPGAETKGVQGACFVRTLGNEFSATTLAKKTCLADGLDGADPFWGHTFLVCVIGKPKTRLALCADVRILSRVGQKTMNEVFSSFNGFIFLIFFRRFFDFLQTTFLISPHILRAPGSKG